ncbi:MAG: hypothetical protein N4A54_04055 [Peptostreptococcaceae bacterium]|jgi:hypothetical protein|nr:hypothetical protein [Peptostreptococcaceae bacterium]
MSETARLIGEQIIAFFDPVKEIMRAVSDPVCYIAMGTGILLMVCGNPKRGLRMIKWSGVGYLAFQFLPMFMEFLRNIANTSN